MDLKQIKDLMAAMGKTQMKRIRIKRDNFELELDKEDIFNPRNADHETHSSIHQPGVYRETLRVRPNDIPPSLSPPLHQEPHKEEPGLFIKSPMVGTYYGSPGPDEPSFVKVGDRVEKDTVVCIVEAMKVMNEVKAGVQGIVKEILVDNGHPVEFGTKLFKVG